MSPGLKLDHAAIRQMISSRAFSDLVHDAALDIAAAVHASKPGSDVAVDRYTTDRAAASVTIRDVRGRIWQARDGVLTRAAAAAGLEVTEAPD